MNTHESIPLRGKRFLSEEKVDSILAIALDHECLYPICSQWATTHAAGCSVAGMVVRAMRANLNFLKDQVDICWGELMYERDFSAEKLEEHIDILGALNLLLFTFTADRISTPLNDSDNEARETVNILTIAFAKLPQEDLAVFNESIIQIRSILENEVLLEMMELQNNIQKDQESGRNKDCQDEIRILLHEIVGQKLSDIYEVLVALIKKTDSIIKKVRKDWKTDLCQIQTDRQCAPSSRKWRE